MENAADRKSIRRLEKAAKAAAAQRSSDLNEQWGYVFYPT
jgi:hypothetical protein